jgi:hypothetical protein
MPFHVLVHSILQMPSRTDFENPFHPMVDKLRGTSLNVDTTKSYLDQMRYIKKALVGPGSSDPSKSIQQLYPILTNVPADPTRPASDPNNDIATYVSRITEIIAYASEHFIIGHNDLTKLALFNNAPDPAAALAEWRSVMGDVIKYIAAEYTKILQFMGDANEQIDDGSGGHIPRGRLFADEGRFGEGPSGLGEVYNRPSRRGGNQQTTTDGGNGGTGAGNDTGPSSGPIGGYSVDEFRTNVTELADLFSKVEAADQAAQASPNDVLLEQAAAAADNAFLQKLANIAMASGDIPTWEKVADALRNGQDPYLGHGPSVQSPSGAPASEPGSKKNVLGKESRIALKRKGISDKFIDAVDAAFKDGDINFDELNRLRSILNNEAQWSFVVEHINKLTKDTLKSVGMERPEGDELENRRRSDAMLNENALSKANEALLMQFFNATNKAARKAYPADDGGITMPARDSKGLPLPPGPDGKPVAGPPPSWGGDRQNSFLWLYHASHPGNFIARDLLFQRFLGLRNHFPEAKMLGWMVAEVYDIFPQKSRITSALNTALHALEKPDAQFGTVASELRNKLEKDTRTVKDVKYATALDAIDGVVSILKNIFSVDEGLTKAFTVKQPKKDYFGKEMKDKDGNVIMEEVTKYKPLYTADERLQQAQDVLKSFAERNGWLGLTEEDFNLKDVNGKPVLNMNAVTEFARKLAMQNSEGKLNESIVKDMFERGSLEAHCPGHPGRMSAGGHSGGPSAGRHR